MSIGFSSSNELNVAVENQTMILEEVFVGGIGFLNFLRSVLIALSDGVVSGRNKHGLVNNRGSWL